MGKVRPRGRGNCYLIGFLLVANKVSWWGKVKHRTRENCYLIGFLLAASKVKPVGSRNNCAWLASCCLSDGLFNAMVHDAPWAPARVKFGPD